MDAPTLLVLLKRVLDGLIDRAIRVISYACDGTEVERAVQRLFLDETVTEKKQYEIKNPRTGCSPTIAQFGIYRGQVITMIQDSKHALKTMRNNLFSGARLLTFGNSVSLYRHIVDIAEGPGTPLFNRDVTKVDQQDDNAAVRLFSADVLKYIADHHPDYIGEIVYLFVFGELIDAYQNRSIEHLERIKLALRARYFLDSWETFLKVCGYRRNHYFISREANDILQIIIEGLISLIIIHRDHLPALAPLLPWLHSSEACEHFFGEARHVVKDFSYLDLIYMIPQLRIKLKQAILRGKSSDGKARAAGYSHTYFDHEGLNLVVLSTYPTDTQIYSVAEIAAQEANSLISLLGVNAELLHRPQHSIWLPSIDSWLEDGLDALELESDSDDGDGDLTEAEELQRILDDEETSPISRSERINRKCMNLTSAAVAIVTEEAAVMCVTVFYILFSFLANFFSRKSFATIDEDSEELESLISEEYVQARHAMEQYNLKTRKLPPVRIADENSRPLGHGAAQYNDLDFEMLVEMRQKHQTKQAASGVRMKKTTKASDDTSGL